MTFWRTFKWWEVLLFVILTSASFTSLVLWVTGFIGNAILFWIGLIGIIALSYLMFELVRVSKFTLTADYLFLKVHKYGRTVDIAIHCRDMLWVFAIDYPKKNCVQLAYWDWDFRKVEVINIPAPRKGKKELFIKCLYNQMRKYDLSHIITPQYINESRTGVQIKIEDCSFIDYSRLNKDLMIALVQCDNRAVLLVGCYTGEREEIVQTVPPEVKSSRYVYCNFSSVVHLKYKTVDEAINDVKWDYSTNKEIRAIDEIAAERFESTGYGEFY